MGYVVENQVKLHRWVVWFLAKRLAKQLSLKKYTLSGSYRRGKRWCNDIDLLVPIESESEAEGLIILLRKLGWKPRPFRESNDMVFSRQFLKRTSMGYIVLDLFLAPPGTWGNALLFTTGSKEFNDGIRENLIKKGFSWANPRYFTHIKTDKRVSFMSEKAALAFLDMKWTKPSNRI